MKKRLAFAAIILIASMVACSFPGSEIITEPDVEVTHITKVWVTPPSGPGDFTVWVTYRSLWAGRPPGDIICRYVTPDGATFGIDKISVISEHKDTRVWETHTSSIPFSVKRNGVTTPGKYVANCTDERDTYPTDAEFIVTGTATEPPVVTADVAYCGSPKMFVASIWNCVELTGMAS